MELDDQEFDYDWTRPNVSFDDIAGYYEIKERLTKEIIRPVQAAARSDDPYDRFGIEPLCGILFYGPPGTGKTTFVRALAGELEVPFVELGPAEIKGKWISEGPQPVRQLFEEANSIGRCVILLNEVEHLFDNRGVGAEAPHAENREVINELFVHLGADDRTAIVVGTTSQLEDINPAILGPRRLATQVEI